ncbi:histidine phosphatase family protein [Granulicella arctica]|uniref:histidine phosphatase family protein n=1 Tax=Granulicella arctica TaxID=940613 RepID=UPI0021E0058E|nr:histidine phosphatase family protein [Granulicella arctica]
MTSRISFISHAVTSAIRKSSFPANESLEDFQLARIALLQWQSPRAQQVLAGPEKRTLETASALGLTAISSAELRDLDCGLWSGRDLGELEREDPSALVAWLTDPDAHPHGGESINDLLARVAAWLELQSLLGHTVAITHPAVIRAAVIHVLGAPAQAFWRLDIAPLSLTDLRYNGRVWTVRSTASLLTPQDASGD